MLKNFVLQLAAAPGLSAVVSLAATPPGFRSWGSNFASGDQVLYAMTDGERDEEGEGVFTAGSPDTITRTTVLSNSAGNTSRINFPGQTSVYCDLPSERAVYLTSAGHLANKGVVIGQWRTVGIYALAASGGQIIPLSAAFRRYRLTLQDVTVSGPLQIVMQFSADGGSTFVTTNTQWGMLMAGTPGVGAVTTYYSAGTTIALTAAGLPAGNLVDGTFDISRGAGGGPASIRGNSHGFDTLSTGYTGLFSGKTTPAGPMSAIRVAPSTGNISGTIMMEGLS